MFFYSRLFSYICIEQSSNLRSRYCTKTYNMKNWDKNWNLLVIPMSWLLIYILEVNTNIFHIEDYGIVMVLVLFLLPIAYLNIKSKLGEDKIYNDGICTYCKTKWIVIEHHEDINCTEYKCECGRHTFLRTLQNGN